MVAKKEPPKGQKLCFGQLSSGKRTLYARPKDLSARLWIPCNKMQKKHRPFSAQSEPTPGKQNRPKAPTPQPPWRAFPPPISASNGRVEPTRSKRQTACLAQSRKGASSAERLSQERWKLKPSEAPAKPRTVAVVKTVWGSHLGLVHPF